MNDADDLIDRVYEIDVKIGDVFDDVIVVETQKYRVTAANFLTPTERELIPHLLAANPVEGKRLHADCELYEFRVPKRPNVRVYYLTQNERTQIYLLTVVRSGPGPTKRGFAIVKAIIRRIFEFVALTNILYSGAWQEKKNNEKSQ